MLHSCTTQEHHSDENSKISITQEFMNNAVDLYLSDLPPNSEELLKKYEHLITQSRSNSQCDYDIASNSLVTCVGSDASGILNLDGCSIAYTVHFTFCQDIGMQIDDIVWSPSNNQACNNSSIVQAALDIANLPFGYNFHYTAINIIRSRILNDAQPQLVQFINSQVGSSWTYFIRTFTEHTCYNQVGDQFEACGTSCCERNLLLENNNGDLEQVVSSISYGGCQVLNNSTHENVSCDYKGDCTGTK